MTENVLGQFIAGFSWPPMFKSWEKIAPRLEQMRDIHQAFKMSMHCATERCAQFSGNNVQLSGRVACAGIPRPCFFCFRRATL